MFGILGSEHGFREGAWLRKRPNQKPGRSPSASAEKKTIKVVPPVRHDGDDRLYYDDGLYYDDRQDIVSPPPYAPREEPQHSKRGVSRQQQAAYYSDHPLSNRASAVVDLRASGRDEAAYGNGQVAAAYPNRGKPQSNLHRSGSGASNRGPGRASARMVAYEGQEPGVPFRIVEAPAAVPAPNHPHPGIQRGSSRSQHSKSSSATAQSSHHSDRQYESAHGNTHDSKSQSVKRSNHGSQRRTGLAPVQEDAYYSGSAVARNGNYGGQPLVRSRTRRSAAIAEDQHNHQSAGQASRHSKRSAIDVPRPSHHSDRKPSGAAHEAQRGSHHTAQYTIHNDFAAPEEATRGRRDSGYDSGRSPPAGSGEKRHAKLLGGDRNVTLAEF
ncbi:MAG: hypothetical protein Q9224_006595 [Gallowayella concinna]